MPVATATAPALRNAWILGLDPTARADLASAVDQAEALELQLRGPSGAVIATESIDIIDTHYLLSIPESDLRDEGAVDPDHDVEMDTLVEEWLADLDSTNSDYRSDDETSFARYQILIRLVDHDSLP